MVAVPRCKGCLICRKRSVKCDEIRPSCSQCRRGGRQCTGYDLPLTFISQHPERSTQISRPSKERRKLPLSSNEDVPETGYTPARSFYQLRVAPIRESQMIPNIESPGLNRVQLVSSFVSNLFPPDSLLPQLSFFADWLWLVPQYTSRSLHLDYAAQSLALGYFGRETGNSSLERESCQAYSQALRYLSWAIQDVEYGLSSDTLCATMLLSFYEMYMPTEKTSWVRHAGGAGRLMQIRGAHRHREGFDHVMFLGFRGIIIGEAVALRKPCFLDSDDWRDIVKADGNQTTLFLFYNEFSNLFAAIPGIAARLSLAADERYAIPSRDIVRADGAKLRADLQEWYSRFVSAFPSSEQPVIQALATSSNGSVQRPYYPDDTWTAAWLASLYACLILLNTRISQLSHDDTTEKSAELLNKLCIAVSRCSRAGNSGGQCLAFVLPIALSLCKEELSRWIDESLVSLSRCGGVSEAQISMLGNFVRVKL